LLLIVLLLFAIKFLLSLEYLRSGRVVVLGAIQLVALPLISLRISLLPFVLAFSVLLPALGPSGRTLWNRFRRRQTRSFGSLRPGLIKVAAHLVIAITLSQTGLYAYREWNDELSEKEPAYMYKDGFFLLGTVAPIVQPGDFPASALRHSIFDNVKINLRDPHLRIAQVFSEGGLDDVLTKRVTETFGGDGVVLPNNAAGETADNAIRRDPAGFLRLALNTWLEYFDSRYLSQTVEREEGTTPASEGFKHVFRQEFGHEYSNAWLSSPVQRWHKIALAWNQFLMVLPILFTGFAFFSRGRNVSKLIYLGVAGWIFLLPATVTAEPTVRYLVALEWIAPLSIGGLLVSLAPGVFASGYDLRGLAGALNYSEGVRRTDHRLNLVLPS
jgi:hypothetical protein